MQCYFTQQFIFLTHMLFVRVFYGDLSGKYFILNTTVRVKTIVRNRFSRFRVS